MGLFYLKKNDFEEEDGKTAQFTDFLTGPATAESSELEKLKAKEEESIKEQEEKDNKGKNEQQ